MNRLQRFGDAQRAVFFLCWGAYFTAYLCRNVLGAAMPAILASTGWDKGETGLAGTGFFVCYGLGQLVNGYLADRLDPVRMIAGGLCLSGLCNAAMAASAAPWQFLAVWCVNGYALSLLWAPIIRLFATRLRGETRMNAGVRISLTIPAGTFACFGLTAAMIRFFTWRVAFAAVGCAGLAAAALFYIFMQRLPALPEPDGRTEAHAPASPPAAMPVKRFVGLAVSAGLLFTAVAIMANGAVKDGVTMWISTYLAEVYGMGPAFSALASGVLPVTNLAGVYFAAWLNGRMRNEMRASAVLFGISGIALALLHFAKGAPAALPILCFGVSTASMLGANTLLVTLMPLHFAAVGRSATVSGFLNACSYGASALASFLVGLLSARGGWNAAVLLWILAALAGAAVCLAGGTAWKRQLQTERKETA